MFYLQEQSPIMMGFLACPFSGPLKKRQGEGSVCVPCAELGGPMIWPSTRVWTSAFLASLPSVRLRQKGGNVLKRVSEGLKMEAPLLIFLVILCSDSECRYTFRISILRLGSPTRTGKYGPIPMHRTATRITDHGGNWPFAPRLEIMAVADLSTW